MAYSYGKKTKVRARAASAPPIPDRIGDVYRQRAAQKRAAVQARLRAQQRYRDNPEMYGQDGGMSPDEAYQRGDQYPERGRRKYKRNTWRRSGRYNPEGRGEAVGDRPIFRY